MNHPFFCDRELIIGFTIDRDLADEIGITITLKAKQEFLNGLFDETLGLHYALERTVHE